MVSAAEVGKEKEWEPVVHMWEHQMLQLVSVEAETTEESKFPLQPLCLLLILDIRVCQTTCQSRSNYQVTDLTNASRIIHVFSFIFCEKRFN